MWNSGFIDWERGQEQIIKAAVVGQKSIFSLTVQA
jgi:hypothetical protein